MLLRQNNENKAFLLENSDDSDEATSNSGFSGFNSSEDEVIDGGEKKKTKPEKWTAVKNLSLNLKKLKGKRPWTSDKTKNPAEGREER